VSVPSRRARPDTEAAASALAALGLALGEEVRFRRPDRARWQPGLVQRVERDGSIGITDANGAARAVPLTSISVRVRPRHPGGTPPPRWEPLTDRAARIEQLTLRWDELT
jgi:hypothetical protein